MRGSQNSCRNVIFKISSIFFFFTFISGWKAFDFEWHAVHSKQKKKILTEQKQKKNLQPNFTFWAPFLNNTQLITLNGWMVLLLLRLFAGALKTENTIHVPTHTLTKQVSYPNTFVIYQKKKEKKRILVAFVCVCV